MKLDIDPMLVDAIEIHFCFAEPSYKVGIQNYQYSDNVAWYTSTPSKIETTPRCDCCKYYKKEGESPENPDTNYGKCRRYAPRLDEPSVRVKGSYWCGDFKEVP
jgi:hypothetical protein